eukprot:475027-Prorocentrum_minimum.AAC.1
MEPDPNDPGVASSGGRSVRVRGESAPSDADGLGLGSRSDGRASVAVASGIKLLTAPSATPRPMLRIRAPGYDPYLR